MNSSIDKKWKSSDSHDLDPNSFIDSKVKPYFDMCLVIVAFVEQKYIDKGLALTQSQSI